MPRNPDIYNVHPLFALRDASFLASARTELVQAKEIAVSELRRLHGCVSTLERARQEAMASADPPLPEDLPPGRDWFSELRVGVHANPSMNHLHIHLLSKDMHSDSLKHRQHYQSFNTEFLCTIDEMPLDEIEADWRMKEGSEMLSGRDSVCWRCGKDFGHSWKKLKAHLAEEFETWRRG
jgi:aprataxin